MKKIDRLLIKAREAKRQDGDALKLAFIAPAYLLDEPEGSPNYERWGLVAYVEGSHGTRTNTETAFYNTQEEAAQAARNMEAAFAPAGKRKSEAVYITF